MMIAKPLAKAMASFAMFALALGLVAANEYPPKDFKIAFLGDQGLGPGSEATLQLVKREGSHALVHLGDFDYTDNPAAWEDQTNRILGPDFPQIAVVGNHDLLGWPGTGGYYQFIRERLAKMGVSVKGEAGVKCSFHYQGIFFVLTAPGLLGTGYPEFIRTQLTADTSIWKISAWHVNQALMQVGSKGDEAGWGVYEQSRLGGAIIATAHEHTYSRTHLLSSMQNQVVASRSGPLRIRPGRTFAFVSGLGGSPEIRPQYRFGDWWAKVYTATQGAVPGALFATFHVDDNPRKARFYFKNIHNAVIDSFEVFSDTFKVVPPEIPKPGPSPRPRTLELNPDELGLSPGADIRVHDVSGRTLAIYQNLMAPVLIDMQGNGLIFVRVEDRNHRLLRKILLMP